MADTFTTSSPKGGVLFYEIDIDGPIPTKYQLDHLHTKYEVGQIPEATLRFTEGKGKPDNDMDAGDGGKKFEPGQKVKIKLGSAEGTKDVFNGTLMKVGVKSAGEGDTVIELTAKHDMVKMTVDRKTAHHLEMTDSDVFGKILGEYGLAGDVGSTTPLHEDLTQFEAKDLDFIQSRADTVGFVVAGTVDGKVDVCKPEVSGPVAKYTYGIDIADCDFSIDPNKQVKEFEAVSWDPETQEVIEAKSSEPSVNAQGNIQGTKLAEVMGNKTHRLHSMGPLSKKELQDWVDSSLLFMRLGRIQGSITVDGNFDIVINKVVTVEGVGPELSGDAYANCVEHSVESGFWQTTVHFGSPKESFMQTEGGESISSPSAGGQMPGVNGLQLGKVVKVHSDPAKGFRVQVNIPVIGKKSELLWARICQTQGSNKSGFYVLPEVDDEVVIGFINQDPRFPVIICSVYSKALPMPVDPDAGGEWDGQQDNNNIKGFFSREGLKMQFQEMDKIIKIETPAGNIITMTEKDKEISIVDENKNHIVMSPTGIDVYTPKDFTLKADKNVKMEAGMSFEMKSGTSMKAQSGTSLDTKAGTSATHEGATGITVKTSAICTVKGALIKLN